MGEDLKTALDVEFDAGAAERIRSGWWASQTAQIRPVLHGQRERVVSYYNTAVHVHARVAEMKSLDYVA